MTISMYLAWLFVGFMTKFFYKRISTSAAIWMIPIYFILLVLFGLIFIFGLVVNLYLIVSYS